MYEKYLKKVQEILKNGIINIQKSYEKYLKKGIKSIKNRIARLSQKHWKNLHRLSERLTMVA